MHGSYLEEIINQLKQTELRVEWDLREEKLGYKMREAQMKKVPYVLVIGDKEKQNQTVNVRQYGVDTSIEMNLDAFIDHMKQVIKDKSIS
ncbi:MULTISPECIES: His/Gly/Thr/Pro-type tRNA ligase C-terminal domain-containing protein [Paraliobacillus]|uniref:His/Gly/Thr/Pro-type tRNA ligase C-terminal domain-containing protein n=1 Tax=Paraliobacillus TaxID=200903 RepID=UPI001E5CBDD7|nr:MULTISPECIES: His/Gly/Thr/Pro-type tRNA ligase C-terminal domain-containing protein [Paraliobacillus]